MAVCPDCYMDEHPGHKRRPFVEVYHEKRKTVNNALEAFDPKINQFVVQEGKMRGKIDKIIKEGQSQLEDVKGLEDLIKEAISTKKTRE